MKKLLIFLFFISSCHFFTYAQRTKVIHDIELKGEWPHSSKEFEIHAKKNTIGSYSVLIRFNSFENTSGVNNPSLLVVNNSGNILSLKPMDENKHANCSYRYYYIRGYQSRRLDSSFVYRLPFSESKTSVMAISLYNIDNLYFNGKSGANWCSWQFKLNKNDTVYAMRKGMVVDVDDKHDPLDVNGVSFNTKYNSLTVEHVDGTLCRYHVIEKSSMMVSLGDMVFPGTPLAKAGVFDNSNNYQVRVDIHYPEVDRNISNPEVSPFRHVYYNPCFMTHQGVKKLKHGDEVIAVMTKDLLQKEMTKREIKKYKP